MALAATVGLTALKLGAGYVSGSIGVLSEGIHSFLDLVSAAVAFFTVREAGKPADHEHPFGHGKFETLSSLFESLLLIVAAALIALEAVDHLRHPKPLSHEGLAIGVIFISLVISYLVYRHNLHAAQVTESSAIQVNALHFLSDVVASAAVLVGLVVIRITGWVVIDAILAFGVAAYIVAISYKQVKGALNELADTQLPEPEVQAIQGILEEFKGRTIDAHDLRTRRSGAVRHIDFHLTVCGEMSVHDSHEVCDEMETRITQVFPRSSVNIHVEPCVHRTSACRELCELYQKKKAGSHE